MKIMTFNFTASMVLVVKVIEFIAGVLVGMIINVLDNNAYNFEESSFLLVLLRMLFQCLYCRLFSETILHSSFSFFVQNTYSLMKEERKE